jgi:hypothetical protein
MSYKRLWKIKTRRIISEFQETGATAVDIAPKYGLTAKSVSEICRRSLAVSEIGDCPKDKIKRGLFRGYFEIVEPILKKNGVTWAQYFGANRQRRLVATRWEAWAALNSAGKPYVHIACYSNKDHSTIMHGVKMWRARHAENKRTDVPHAFSTGAFVGSRGKPGGGPHRIPPFISQEAQ